MSYASSRSTSRRGVGSGVGGASRTLSGVRHWGPQGDGLRDSIAVTLAVMIVLAIPYRRGEAWARWAVPLNRRRLRTALTAYAAFTIEHAGPRHERPGDRRVGCRRSMSLAEFYRCPIAPAVSRGHHKPSSTFAQPIADPSRRCCGCVVNIARVAS